MRKPPRPRDENLNDFSSDEYWEQTAYAGLTPRVSQSGDRAHYGHITREGSPWLRWILV